jgi:cobalt-precorrin-5B (C1)-methyltransferase
VEPEYEGQPAVEPNRPLRRGWTTGACATAAAKAAYIALITGQFPDPVEITLPRGQKPAFSLAVQRLNDEPSTDGRPSVAAATAGIIKDAGDDPDVTHGALVVSTVRRGRIGSGVSFRAGPGVGTVTKAGLPLAVGEPAINPVPRQMMRDAIAEVASDLGASGDVVVEISIPNGEEIAKKTWNPRLGILGGLSILGTTGIVIPYSCSAWIASIHRGIDVARAAGVRHVAGATGTTSEATVARLYGLPEDALIDMGDFVGGMLRYLRYHPVQRVTIAGGFAKLSKLAAGYLDLHSGRSQVDVAQLAAMAAEIGADPALVARMAQANTALEVLGLAESAQLPLGDVIAVRARDTALQVVESVGIDVDVVVIDRVGNPIGRAG